MEKHIFPIRSSMLWINKILSLIGAWLMSITPYRMAPFKLTKLKKQLEDETTRRFIAEIVHST